MDKNIELPELNLFFEGDEKHLSEETLDAIYKYHKENPSSGVYKKIEAMILEWLKNKSEKGIYKSFCVLAGMRRYELDKKATFSCRFDYLSKRISEAAINFRKLESETSSSDLWEVLMSENQYYFDKYGFLIISFANEGEKLMLENYIADNFGLKYERLEKAVNKLVGYEDICKECLFWIQNGTFVSPDECLRIEGYSAQDIFEKTYLKPIGAFNYMVSLRKNPKTALDNLKKGLPRK